MQTSRLLLSIILILSSACVELRPKANSKAHTAVNSKVLVSSLNVWTSKPTDFLSNKINNNSHEINQEFQVDDEIAIDFITYKRSVDSTEIKTDIINISPFNNGFFEGQLIEYYRIYNGLQFSDSILMDSQTTDLIQKGISIQFVNNQNLKALCTLESLNAKVDQNTFVFSINNHSNCDELNQIINNVSPLKISIVNNLIYPEQVAVINNGAPFKDRKFAAKEIKQNDLYENLEKTNIETEMLIRFDIKLNRYK